MRVLLSTNRRLSVAHEERFIRAVEGYGHEVVLGDFHSLEEVLRGVEVAVVRSDSVTAANLDSVPDLRMVIRLGSGTDSVDLDACTERDVVVHCTPGCNANAVAEMVIGLIITRYRANFAGIAIGSELMSKTLGLYGYGSVARRVAQIARALHMEVVVYHPNSSVHDSIEDNGLQHTRSLEELFRQCDIVSLHAPLTSSTRGVIGKDHLTMMPAHGLLVNSARQDIVSEIGMRQAFLERNDISYISDVDTTRDLEDVCGPGRYLRTGRKMGACTIESNGRCLDAALRIIEEYLAGP